MLRWITLARSWPVLVRVGIATLAVAAATVVQMPIGDNFPGQPFLLYFVAVMASAGVLGRTAGFVAVAETSIASALYHEPLYSLKLTHPIHLLAVEIYAVVAALSVEALCRLVEGALAEKSATNSAHVQREEAEARLADREVELKLIRHSEAQFRANKALSRILGYPVNELVTTSIKDVTYPADLDVDLVRLRRVREGKIDSYDTEKRYVRKDGTVIWCRKTEGCVRKNDGSIDYFVSVIEDISARKQAEKELRKNEERFRSSLLYCPLPILLFDDHEKILAISESWVEQSGYLREELRRVEDWVMRAYPERQGEMLQEIRQTIITSTEPEARSAERTIRTKDGRERLWSFVFSPLTVESGGRHLFVGVAQDVTDEKAHVEQVHLLMREINHRAKNMLSLVQVIARRTAARDPDDFVDRFTRRIQALAANQDLLVQNDWQGIDIEDLVRVQLAHFADLVGSKITVRGSPVRLNAAAAQAIGLALHELSTNAGKYGALSIDAGGIDVDWRFENDIFEMSWIERNGPPVSQPGQRGFGSVVITSMVEQTVNGEVRLDYAPSGIVWSVTCPAVNVLEQNAYRNLKPSTRPALAPARSPVLQHPAGQMSH